MRQDTRCGHPSGCPRSALHEMGTGPFWTRACCRHADELMETLSHEVPEAEGRAGLARFRAEHKATHGWPDGMRGSGK